MQANCVTRVAHDASDIYSHTSHKYSPVCMDLQRTPPVAASDPSGSPRPDPAASPRARPYIMSKNFPGDFFDNKNCLPDEVPRPHAAA